jgi:hypothetical protein
LTLTAREIDDFPFAQACAQDITAGLSTGGHALHSENDAADQ